MSDEQKLTLAAYLIAYSVVTGDPAVDTKLRILLKTIKVSQRFFVKVRESVCEIRTHLTEDALSIVLRPQEILQQRLSKIVRISIEQGDFRCR